MALHYKEMGIVTFVLSYWGLKNIGILSGGQMAEIAIVEGKI